MGLPYAEGLDIAHFQRIFDNKSESYKLFWFQAILDCVQEQKYVLAYRELVDRMIAAAWYMVSEYKLNLGPSDAIEKIVRRAEGIMNIKSASSRIDIVKGLSLIDDAALLSWKKDLISNVPYRLQAPFCEEIKGSMWHVPLKTLVEQINSNENCPYEFVNMNGFESEIYIRDKWASYFRQNYEVLKGWLQFNMIDYLQKRNPNVPGISLKLSPPEKEDLKDVRDLWRALQKVMPVYEIYSGKELTPEDISIDHFVPWSYVAHDELWNLSPTTKSINSSKSNNLPCWDLYFAPLAALEFGAFQRIKENEFIRKEFEKCAKKHINTEGLVDELFQRTTSQEEFMNRLERLILPSYQAAQNAGFTAWEYTL